MGTGINNRAPREAATLLSKSLIRSVPKDSGRHAVHISRVYGSHHGGSIYSEALVAVLLDQGWTVTLVAEQFGQTTAATEKTGAEQLTLPLFFKSGFVPFLSRLVDVIRLTRLILRRRVSLIFVQGDLPRITYVLLQYFVPLIFFRLDAILTCPANSRFLCNSRTICHKPVGFSCLATHRREQCFGSLGLLHRIGRIIYRLRDQFLLKRLKKFAGISNYIVEVHQRDGVVLYPPCLIASVPVNNSDRDLSRLVFCGRLEVVKGAEDAIRILSQLPKTYRMDVLGDGYGLNSLQRMAQSLGVSDRVEFHGWVDRERRDEVFASSAVLLMPSLWDEAFGMVGIEAFAKGTPVVAYDVGGISEWCKPAAGILVKCGDLNGFADAIKRITSNHKEWRQFSLGAEAIAESNFTLSEFQYRVHELIKNDVSRGQFYS
jgi:glycosyltransferase involved in cell wall biosynthesis